jgi:RNA polymerase sigma-70 factor (ECF subfamily)
MTAFEPHITEPTDEALVQAVQRGGLDAFAPLLDRHLDHVHAFVSVRLPLEHLADEITHETFVFAFHHIHEFQPGTAFRSWLRAVAANKVRAEIERYCREERNRLSYAEHRLVELSATSPELQGSDEAEALSRCLEQVPEPGRTLLALRYHDGHPIADIAQRLGRSLAWARTTLCRLRQQLKECVESRLGAKSA